MTKKISKTKTASAKKTKAKAPVRRRTAKPRPKAEVRVNTADKVTLSGASRAQGSEAQRLREFANKGRKPSSSWLKGSGTQDQVPKPGPTVESRPTSTPQRPSSGPPLTSQKVKYNAKGVSYLTEVNKAMNQEAPKVKGGSGSFQRSQKALETLQEHKTPKSSLWSGVRTRLSKFSASQLDRLGKLSGVAVAVQGLRDLRKGNYGDAALILTAGTGMTLDSVRSAKLAKEPLKKIAKESAQHGPWGRLIKGAGARLAGGALALYDGKQTVEALRSGNHTLATEKGLDTVWSAASLSLVAAPASLAHSLTRLGMSTNINGHSGDKIVTDMFERKVFNGAIGTLQKRDRVDSEMLYSMRHFNQGDLLKVARRHPKSFSRAIVGLQTEISRSSKGERPWLMRELRSYRDVQKRVRT